ncbi:MAG: carbohydrate binding domain-containing protein [Caldilineaceae bacterium]
MILTKQSTNLKFPFSVLQCIHWALFVMVIIGASGLSPYMVYAAPQQDTNACTLQIDIIAAPFVVVDSNKPGVQGPKVATLSARLTNKGAAAVQNVQMMIGNGATPGSFNLVSGKSLLLLTNEAATRKLQTLGAGESTVFYWTITYPFTYDVTYPYTLWATADGGCSASQSSQITTQSQISATANKLMPKGALLLTAPQQALPGQLLTVQLIGFDLGTVGQGPKATSPYNAWLQPIGNSNFDPSCLRLVSTSVLLKSISATPFVNQLYFENLQNYKTNTADYVTYTFMVLRKCNTNVLPYQQAASGTQEKYNGDYDGNTTRVTFTSSQEGVNLRLEIKADEDKATPDGHLHLKTKFNADKDVLGNPASGNPAIITVEIPKNTAYVGGSAKTTIGANLEYSTDGGASWQATAPSDLTKITHLRWVCTQPIGTSDNFGYYEVVINHNFTGNSVTATAAGGIINTPPLTTATTTVNSPVAPPTPTPTPSPTPTPAPTRSSVQSAGNGGLESEPLGGVPSTFIGSVGDKDAAKAAMQQEVSRIHKARLLEALNLKIVDVLPATGPAGSTPSKVIPKDVLAITDAPDAQAVDFVNEQSQVKASALGILTVDKPYPHDYAVCNRFKDYVFDAIDPLTVTLPSNVNTWFWHASSHKGDTIHEDAFVFNIFVDEVNKQFHVDSHWVKDDYPATLPYRFDYIFNMQVWGNNIPDSQALLLGILDKLAQVDGGAWQTIYHNQSKPTAPELYVNQVQYQADEVHLSIDNLSPDQQPVRLYGAWRSHIDRNTLVPFEYDILVPVHQTDLALVFPGLLDVTIYVENNGFTDKVYTGSGLWFSVNPADTGKTQMTLGECRTLDSIDTRDLLLAGCANITTPNLDGVDRFGIGRTLNPNGRNVDVSPYKAVRFWAQGDGTPVRIILETASITDGDYYQTTFTPDSRWRQYIIPLNQFTQRGFGAAKAWTGADVKAVVWLNATATNKALNLALDQVTFTTSGLLTLDQQPADSADTAARLLQVSAPDGVDVDQMFLHYSVDGGKNFITQSLTLQNGVTTGAIYQGQIPGQALGSDVVYYIEAHQTNGYVSFSPLDAPASYYRYRVDDRNSVLVDDFAGPQLLNRLSGGPGLFNSPTAGGVLRAYRQAQQLVLDYDVSQAKQIAGYFTALANLDARAYTTLDLLVRGENGGESFLVGLSDTKGAEPRLSVGDLLPGGITKNWQWVQIPLASFPTSLERSALANLSLTFFNNYAPTSGRVYIKEIRFSSLATPLVIDSFDDANLQMNGQGLGYWTTAPNSTLQVTTTVGDATSSTGAALRLDYNVNTNGYTIWHSNLGKVSTTADAFLQLWVKGANQAIGPTLYLTSGNVRAVVALADYVKLTNNWQLAEIPISAFAKQGLDLNQLDGFEVIFEHGKGSGTFWIDNVRIGSRSAPQAGQRVLYMTDQDAAQIALHLADGSRWQARADVDWLIPTYTGNGPSTLTISTLAWNRAPGDYVGNIVVTSANGQTETVTVHQTVTQATVPPVHLYLPTVNR